MDSVIVDNYIERILVDKNKHSLLIDKEGNRANCQFNADRYKLAIVTAMRGHNAD